MAMNYDVQASIEAAIEHLSNCSDEMKAVSVEQIAEIILEDFDVVVTPSEIELMM